MGGSGCRTHDRVHVRRRHRHRLGPVFVPAELDRVPARHDQSEVLGTALFDGIHEAWAALPEDDRPVLLAFGQSLGSMGGETAFAEPDLTGSIASITSRYDGALFTGPGPATKEPMGRWSTPRRREPVVETDWSRGNRMSVWRIGSPTSTPRTRLGVSAGALGPPPVGRHRYLAARQPVEASGWAEDPSAYDIPPAATWVPFVTFVQESFDLMAGFSATPGFGHDYRTDFVHSWAAIAPPEGGRRRTRIAEHAPRPGWRSVTRVTTEQRSASRSSHSSATTSRSTLVPDSVHFVTNTAAIRGDVRHRSRCRTVPARRRALP